MKRIWPAEPIVHHEPNTKGGRDLVAGDLHGYFDTLEEALKTLRFDPAHDRLFGVGDLVDRGPRSLRPLRTGSFGIPPRVVAYAVPDGAPTAWVIRAVAATHMSIPPSDRRDRRNVLVACGCDLGAGPARCSLP